ncbi:hypothetical protein FTW19_17715 [Terriglobus albidus]|uniref:PAAR motif protein n=1 Tax=Terriglobus albidus TaxID=1592106 RepID=A0A5B9EC45_9BACT|nr:PAAR domain-containing protein [Terriglobus albidus]QEE29662.1 hypothetical protein FTW19_17715 [Terriglobus albidus]
MGQPAAKLGDKVVAVDVHIVMVPSAAGPVPTPLPHPFSGQLQIGLSQNVLIGGLPAATVDSKAVNTPPHLPMPPGISFQVPPSNQASVPAGSVTVLINGKGAVRNGDTAMTCNDPADMPAGTVIAAGTVLAG